ncbi:unnamed protein product [Tilletia controversa]|nr:unnamed protein product [Tilletia controversa]
MARTKSKAAKKADLALRKDAVKEGPATNQPIDAAAGPSAPGPSAAPSSSGGPGAHGVGHDHDNEHQGSGGSSEDHGQANIPSTPYLRVCSVCGTQTGRNPRKTPGGKMRFCETHEPRCTMPLRKAMKHFSQYRSFGGSLSVAELLQAENEGKLTVRNQDQLMIGGSPTKKVYFVKELYDLSRSKQEEGLQVKPAYKEEAIRIKRAQQLERLAEKCRLREKKAQNKAAAAASQQAGNAPHPENSTDINSPSSSPINEAGPSSSVTVSSASFMDVSDDVGDAHNAEAPQLSPPSIASADPQPVTQGFRIKAEPDLEPPMLSPSAGIPAPSDTTVQLKREAEQPLFLPDDF